MAIRDEQINRWAQEIWDLCRIEELYNYLRILRTECYCDSVRRIDAKTIEACMEERSTEEHDSRQLEIPFEWEGQ